MNHLSGKFLGAGLLAGGLSGLSMVLLVGGEGLHQIGMRGDQVHDPF